MKSTALILLLPILANAAESAKPARMYITYTDGRQSTLTMRSMKDCESDRDRLIKEGRAKDVGCFALVVSSWKLVLTYPDGKVQFGRGDTHEGCISLAANALKNIPGVAAQCSFLP